jgi:chromosome segregation ATPase
MPERPDSPISTSPDDGSRRRAAAGPSRRRGGEAGGGGGSRLLGNTIVVVLIGGLAVAGWFIVEQYQRLEADAQALSDAKERIDVLEDRLRVTDEALSETGEETNEQIDFWESEIRKLWAVSNDRNKKWIEDNQTAIAKLEESVSGLRSTAREIQSTLGRHESAFARQQEMVDQLTSVQMQLQQVSRSQRDLVDKVNAAQQAVAKLDSGVANRVAQNAEAIEAIDAYRLQLNSRLADIERRLNNLAGPASL